MKTQKIAFSAIALGSLTALSIDIYLPSMTAITQEFAANPATVRLSITAFLISFALGQLIFGPLSDRFGRRLPLTFGLILYCGANLLCAVAPSVQVLIFARFIQGFGACCGTVTCVAMIRDIYDGPKLTQTIAKVFGIIGLAPIAAPMIGAALDHAFGWRSSFYFLVLISVCLLLWVCYGLPETNKAPSKQLNLFTGYGSIFKNDIFRSYSLINAFSFAGLFGFIATSPSLLMDNMGLSSGTYSLLFSLNAGFYMLGNFVASKLVKRLTLPELAILGSALMIFGALLMGVFSSINQPQATLIPMYLATFGVALAMPAGASGAMTPFKSKAGRATALLGCLRFGTAGLAGTILGSFQLASSLPLAICLLSSGLICISSGLFQFRKTTIGKPIAEF